MGKFAELFEAERAKHKKPESQFSPNGPSIFVRPSTPASPSRAVSSEPEKEESETLEHREWQRVMTALVSLHPVYEWIEDTQPGSFRRIGALEEKCRDVARAGDAEQFNDLKQGYLEVIGQFCEVYLAARLKVESIDIVAIRLGMKQVRLRISENLQQELPSDGRIEVFAREIPHLLVAKPEQILDIFTVKEALPGSQTAST